MSAPSLFVVSTILAGPFHLLTVVSTISLFAVLYTLPLTTLLLIVFYAPVPSFGNAFIWTVMLNAPFYAFVYYMRQTYFEWVWSKVDKQMTDAIVVLTMIGLSGTLVWLALVSVGYSIWWFVV